MPSTIGISNETVTPPILAPALDEILNRFAAAPPMRALVARLSDVNAQTAPIRITGLEGSSPVFLLDALARELKRPILFVTAEAERAFDIIQETESLPLQTGAFHFPSWGTPSYEFHTPQAEMIGRRIAALGALRRGEARVVVAPLVALLEPTITRKRLIDESVHLAAGAELDLTIFADHLSSLGFRRVPNVEEVGDYALRGGIIDFFSPGEERPIRVEFFGDVIETIRAFDVADQRSREDLRSVSLLPRREVPVSDELIERALAKLPTRDAETIREQCLSDSELPGLEWLAPMLGIAQETALDHFPESGVIITDNAPYMNAQIAELRTAAEKRRAHVLRDISQAPDVSSALVTPTRLFVSEKESTRIDITPFHSGKSDVIDFECKRPPAINAHLDTLASLIESYRVSDIAHLIVADNSGQMERMRELLRDNLPGDAPPIQVGMFHGGFFSRVGRLALLTDHEIFTREYRRRRRKKFREGVALSNYTNLESGDFVVHADHGIGRYLKLDSLTVDNRRRDCLLVQYADNGKLFVPIEEFSRISKYAGHDANPTLTPLGSSHWEKLKEKAKETISKLAKELARLYAERKTRPGHAFAPDSSLMRQLESSFPYEETEDQLKAIEDMKRDMESPHPMDRLICGDVGFGKTEVAVRAAMKCVEDGKQAAVLVPTTILAQQHHKTFQTRMAGFPVRIEVLSRFRTKKEQEATLEALARGDVDVIVGTHRLLGKDVMFHDLGLLVIDEEQRFGVTHKERLRQMKATVDTLTMTATPIPRTLQMSLSGARDMSLIVSSPRGRLPITTVVHEFTPEIVAEALLREIDRGGQVFFVHNRVQTIEGVHRYLHKLLPQLSMLVGHGQMSEHVLEREMLDFIEKKAQVLLCTSIIESGLDIPNVNTIVIDRADRFGMSQLYQLRGRVGRSTERAYCYMLTPPYKRMTEDARKRLKAIEAHTELGSGFALAMRDLEIRGAGNLLGARQSGFIDEIGFDMYNRLLEEAVAEIKGDDSARVIETKMEVDVEMYLPESYIDFNQQKVDIYRRLASAKRVEQVVRVQEELLDRYGRMPEPASNLLDASAVKVLASQHGIEKVRLRAGRIELFYSPGKRFERKDVESIRRQVEHPLEFALSEAPVIGVNLSKLPNEQRMQYLRSMMEKMT